MKKTIRTTYHLESEQVERLRQLSKQTRVPMAVYVRQGIDYILSCHEYYEKQRSVLGAGSESIIEAFDKTAKPIEEVIEEIMADVPDEELDKLPKDGAIEHDHYLYGTEKKDGKFKEALTWLIDQALKPFEMLEGVIDACFEPIIYLIDKIKDVFKKVQ